VGRQDGFYAITAGLSLPEISRRNDLLRTGANPFLGAELLGYRE
jgi:hypothetical protein